MSAFGGAAATGQGAGSANADSEESHVAALARGRELTEPDPQGPHPEAWLAGANDLGHVVRPHVRVQVLGGALDQAVGDHQQVAAGSVLASASFWSSSGPTPM